MREVITLQFGQLSNYLGTHFWNIQESYFAYGDQPESPVDHDVHFRPGMAADGTETFMPRTVIYDLKGGFGSLRKINALYDADDDGPPASLWNGRASVQREQPIEPSQYQKSLDAGTVPSELTTSGVRYWSDFNRVFFHPKSIVQLNEFELNSTILPFEKWHMGEELFASLDKEHDLIDRDMRPFVEEADNMQGIQVMTGLDDAWGGFATHYLERLRDEYGKTPILAWGLQEPLSGLPREKRLLKLVNKARTLAEIYSQASLVIPLSVPRRLPLSASRLDISSLWHVSALFAAALESSTLYTRLKLSDQTNSSSLGTFTDLLNVSGKQKIATLQMSCAKRPELPETGTQRVSSFSNGRSRSSFDLDHEILGEGGEIIDDDKRPQLDIDLSVLDEDALYQQSRLRRRSPHLFSQISTYRADDAFKIGESERREARLVDRFETSRNPKIHSFKSSLNFPLLDSFPLIFQDDHGVSLKEQMAIRTQLATDSSTMNKMRSLRSSVIRSIGLEDRETIGNDLAEIADGYQEGWSSGSDDNDDED